MSIYHSLNLNHTSLNYIYDTSFRSNKQHHFNVFNEQKIFIMIHGQFIYKTFIAEYVFYSSVTLPMIYQTKLLKSHEVNFIICVFLRKFICNIIILLVKLLKNNMKTLQRGIFLQSFHSNILKMI